MVFLGYQMLFLGYQMVLLRYQMVFLRYAPDTVRKESEIDNSTNLRP